MFDLGNLWHALPWLGNRIEVSEMVILVPEPYTQNRKAYIFCTWKFDLGNDPILHMTLFPWGLSGSAIIFYIDGDSDDWFKYIKKMACHIIYLNIYPWHPMACGIGNEFMQLNYVWNYKQLMHLNYPHLQLPKWVQCMIDIWSQEVNCTIDLSVN